MKPLALPPTIRTAHADEVTPNEEVLKRLKEREGATIVEGYTLQLNPSADIPFRFFSEINIDNHRLWSLFTALASLLPGEVSLIYHHIDDEPTYAPYKNKVQVLEQLAPFPLELTQDGLLQIGLIYQDEERLEEIFIKRAKYIQFWGADEEAFREVVSAFGLQEIEGLQFIDDFPLATEPLKRHHPNARETDDVLKELQGLFA
jgi:DNA-binding Lrp family transcriptional regulator